MKKLALETFIRNGGTLGIRLAKNEENGRYKSSDSSRHRDQKNIQHKKSGNFIKPKYGLGDLEVGSQYRYTKRHFRNTGQVENIPSNCEHASKCFKIGRNEKIRRYRGGSRENADKRIKYRKNPEDREARFMSNTEKLKSLLEIMTSDVSKEFKHDRWSKLPPADMSRTKYLPSSASSEYEKHLRMLRDYYRVYKSEKDDPNSKKIKKDSTLPKQSGYRASELSYLRRPIFIRNSNVPAVGDSYISKNMNRFSQGRGFVNNYLNNIDNNDRVQNHPYIDRNLKSASYNK